ncbi:hypothetical protein TREES_T100015563 [Tupaia chinensis]|uniref:Uncharacterized protein n=1 Tax=Tupaia chinensis TaxID=246437 RepID=L9LEE3_TUPCH|nr:hypothetical protein TREES_T100015563 [Tupaia chinensis]
MPASHPGEIYVRREKRVVPEDRAIPKLSPFLVPKSLPPLAAMQMKEQKEGQPPEATSPTAVGELVQAASESDKGRKRVGAKLITLEEELLLSSSNLKDKQKKNICPLNMPDILLFGKENLSTGSLLLGTVNKLAFHTQPTNHTEDAH